jgi:predicted branched-subunit amino acid permease/branched-subunit amino acid transport protein
MAKDAAGQGDRDHRDGVRATLPVGVAVFGFGISFGVLARAAGMGSVAPVVMSATTFAGSAQFAAVSVLNAGGSVATSVVAAVLLNARYAPIGVSVAPSLHGSWWSRFLHAQLVVDESWAIASEGDGRFNPRVLVGAGLTIYIAWVSGTILGAFGTRCRVPRAVPCTLGAAVDVEARQRGGRARRRDRAVAHTVHPAGGADHRGERRVPARMAPMTQAWIVVVLVGLATIAIKSIGPVLLGGRDLPPRIAALIGLLAPALLGALVAINTFGSGRSLVLDERALGVAAAAVAIWRKAPVLLVVVIAAAVTAVARALL